VCHAGRLKDFLFCPQCGKLQVVLLKSYPRTYYHEEDDTPYHFWPGNFLEDKETLLLKCDERYLDEDQHIAFMQECDEDHYHTHGAESVNYTASILVPDPGPKQVAPRRGSPNMLLVKYCHECYSKKLLKDLP
jgi:hypothetical protein